MVKHKPLIKKTLSLSIFALICIGCKSIIKTINGEHRPQIENEKSLKKFIFEEDLPIEFENSFFLKNSSSRNELVKSDLVYTESDSLILPYGIILFDAEGKGINYKDIENQVCLIDEKQTDSISDYLGWINESVKTEFNLKQLNNSFMDENGNEIAPFKLNERPTVIILWAKYKGKKWAQETKSMITSFQSSSEDYNIFYLNLDPNKYYSQFEK